MKNVIVLVVGLAVGFVAGVFTGRCGAGASNATAPASAATAKAEAVDDVFSGEAKDGELVEVGEYGKFRLNPKQKEIVEKRKIVSDYLAVSHGRRADKAQKIELEKNNPWLLDSFEMEKIHNMHKKMLASLLESRKKAQANN